VHLREIRGFGRGSHHLTPPPVELHDILGLTDRRKQKSGPELGFHVADLCGAYVIRDSLPLAANNHSSR
jgi:hypothetical protein